MEPLGSFTIVDVHTGEGMVKVRPSRQVKFGDREIIHLAVAPGRAHIFGAAGTALPRAG